MTTTDTRAALEAAIAVKAIERDILDRRGLKHDWKSIDDDVRAEIKSSWARIITAHVDAEVARIDADWRAHDLERDAEVARAQADTHEACAALRAICDVVGVDVATGDGWCGRVVSAVALAIVSWRAQAIVERDTALATGDELRAELARRDRAIGEPCARTGDYTVHAYGPDGVEVPWATLSTADKRAICAMVAPDEARRLVDEYREAAAFVRLQRELHPAGPDADDIKAESTARSALLRALGVEP